MLRAAVQQMLAAVRRIQLSIVAGVALAATAAFADEPPPAVVVGSGSAAAIPAWSDQLIDNGLVLPQGDLGAYGDLLIVRTSFVDKPVPPATTGATVLNTAFDLLVGAGYGVTPELTIGGEYQLPVDDATGAFPNAGALSAYAGYTALRDDKTTLVLGGDLQLDFSNGTTATLHLGASLRYKVAPKVAVYTGNLLAPGPYGRQLVIGLNHSAPVALDLPAGVAIQASPRLLAWAETSLAHVKLANTANAVLFADYIPLQLGALYRAAKDVDVGGFLDFSDLENVGNAFAIGVMARYYKHAAPVAPTP
ncbi:MAG: hypothetical protein ACM31C_22645 [Acidobacteriota bacterium]